MAPDNGSNVPGPGSLSPAGHRGCGSAGPPKRPSSARRGEPAGVWRGPEASVSELAPGTARHGATPAADRGVGGGVAWEAGKTSPGGRLEGNALPTRLLGGGKSHGDAGGARGGRHGVPRGSRARSPAARTEGGREGGREGGGGGGREGRRGLANRNQASTQRTTQEFILSRTVEVCRKQTRKAQNLERKGRIPSDPIHTSGNKQLSLPGRRQSPKTTHGCVGGENAPAVTRKHGFQNGLTDHSPRAGVGVGVGDGGGGARGNAGGWGGGGGERVESIAIH